MTKARKVEIQLGKCAFLSRTLSLLAIFVYIVVYNIYLKEGYAEFATDGKSVLFKPLRG